MDIHCEKFQIHISFDRVKVIGDIRNVVECYLCHGLLWKPVQCETCDKTFCLTCIQEFHKEKLEQICLDGCSDYKEKINPPATIRLLVRLQISCCFKSNGCTEVLLYNELEKHEQMCDYQLVNCNGCQQGIIKKNFDQHQNECQYLSIECDKCLTSYKRKAKDLHTPTECLHIQLQHQKSKIEQLEKQAVDQQTKIDRMEQKLQQNDIFWATFFLTIKDSKSYEK